MLPAARLSDDEINELEAFLASDKVPPDCMDLSILDGFFTALLIGPNLILPSQWLPVVWGETEQNTVRFESNDQAQRMVELLMRYYNERADDLHPDNDLFDPLFYYGSKEGKEYTMLELWCTGFMQGVQFDAKGWDSLMQSENDAALLTPMLLFGTESGVEEVLKNPELESRREQLADATGVCVIGIRDFWLARRAPAVPVRRDSEKVGRNDACPCGSGKKFKKCCGAPERLH